MEREHEQAGNGASVNFINAKDDAVGVPGATK